MNTLYVDNYDSFAYTIMAYLKNNGSTVTRITSDQSTHDIKVNTIDRVVLGPGPNGPEDAGNYKEILRMFESSIPVLGICLGHQVLLTHYGTPVKKVPPLHGCTTHIQHTGKGIFKDMSNDIPVARYHSLGAYVDDVSHPLDVTARAKDVVMGVQHKTHNIQGVQFHPESILACHEKMFENFLKG